METTPSLHHIQSPINHITRDQPTENISTPTLLKKNPNKTLKNLQTFTIQAQT